MKNLLVIDDDRSVCSSLEKLLQAEGFQVFAAWSAVEAIEQFRKNPIDLAILDINLGSDDGWSVFQKLSDMNPLVPVIIITAEWGQHDRAVALGAEALIEKPIDIYHFLKIINRVLEQTSNHGLRRVREQRDYCLYRAKDYATMLKGLQEREDTPLELSDGIKSALPSSTVTSVRRRQTVIGQTL